MTKTRIPAALAVILFAAGCGGPGSRKVRERQAEDFDRARTRELAAWVTMPS